MLSLLRPCACEAALATGCVCKLACRRLLQKRYLLARLLRGNAHRGNSCARRRRESLVLCECTDVKFVPCQRACRRAVASDWPPGCRGRSAGGGEHRLCGRQRRDVGGGGGGGPGPLRPPLPLHPLTPPPAPRWSTVFLTRCCRRPCPFSMAAAVGMIVVRLRDHACVWELEGTVSCADSQRPRASDNFLFCPAPRSSTLEHLFSAHGRKSWSIFMQQGQQFCTPLLFALSAACCSPVRHPLVTRHAMQLAFMSSRARGLVSSRVVLSCSSLRCMR